MISIAICTHNRSEDVGFCLAALAPQLAGRGDELIIVDSCSTSQHADALRFLAARFRTHRIRLEQPGLSLARNAALDAARGEWIAFLDDDTLPYPDWLTSLHRVVDAAPGNLAAVGGQTEPMWPEEPAPGGISDRWLFFLSCIQETTRRSAREGGNVCGANLAFRKQSLLAIGRFRSDLGRSGDQLIGGEESLAIKLLLRNGQEVFYDPSIKVKHRIHRDRLTVSWVSKRAYSEGVTEIAMLRAMGDSFPPRLGVSKLALSSLVLSGLFYATGNPDFLIRAKMATGALAARLNT
jgi:glycosyltransferase involved in cell wall biosynthesis